MQSPFAIGGDEQKCALLNHNNDDQDDDGVVQFIFPTDRNEHPSQSSSLQLANGTELSKVVSYAEAEENSNNCEDGPQAEMEPLIGKQDAPEEKSLKSEEEKSSKSSDPKKTEDSSAEAESARIILLQAFFPLFLAGLGQVGAGLVLDHIQHWSAFDEIPELFTLITALVGLKGNLEMTLASRLSTLANMGNMDTQKERLQHIFFNICLVEAQATLLSFLAAIVAVVLRWATTGEIIWSNSLVLIASSLSTGCSAAFLLAVIMIVVIVASRSLKINPDNVATPLAASFGDLITMIILAHMAAFFLRLQPVAPWNSPIVAGALLLLMPLWVTFVLMHPLTKSTLTEGINAIVLAMLISSSSGYMLGYSIRRFQGIAVFQPVINGFGGNLVAVQASRMSTHLHKYWERGKLPAYCNNELLRNPCYIFFGNHPHKTSARVLLLFTIPGHLICLFLIHVIGAGHTSTTPQFVLVYLSAACIQVALLLYICHVMVHWMWGYGIDPDNAAIPYLTALGDFLGTTLLSLSFALLYAIGDHDLDVGD